MKKYIKNVSAPIIATSLATIGFASYKILKKKYPQKVDNVNKNIKNTLNNFKIKNKQKTISHNDNHFYKDYDNISISTKTNKNITTGNNINKNNCLSQNNIISDNKNLKNNQNVDNQNNNIDTQQSITFTAINVDNNITFTDATTFKEEISPLQSVDEQIHTQPKEHTNCINNETIQHLEPEELKEIDDFFKSIAEEETKQHQKEEIENLQNTFNQNINEILLPDNYIEDEIRYQLCLSNKEPITKETLQKLERIDFFEIDDYDIDIYCDFLEKYTNIKSIVIDSLNATKYNTIVEQNQQKHCLKNISPLTKLKSLQELSFNWGIENIDFNCISSLTNLKKLEIKFGMLKNIDFISNLKSLEHLEIMISNNVTDLSPLLTLSNLKNLYIYTNIKLDISSLKNIKSLQNIYINGESINIF